MDRRGMDMRRLVYVLVAMGALLAGVLGTVAVPAPAHADGTPIAQLTATVNPPPQPNGLLRLCVTSRSLDPNGTCINIPPSSDVPATPGGSYGKATASTNHWSGGSWFTFGFQGQITISGQTFTGVASGGGSFDAGGNVGPTVPPFTLSGTSPTGSLTATCSGDIYAAAGPPLGPGPLGPIGGATSVLNCDGSANGGATGHVTLMSAYRASDYSGGFAGETFYYEGAFAGT